ncbi:methyltransferase family protein [Oscillibacter sp.]|uniref:methyltransferase family protein n=1 Tax=Oscillibacter sp. TaxID=1945593 RepID=UPI002D7F77C4|nr:isoprenylcysteine carboxylmethyltransferase family protein [Oscillibacter sp.]
MKKSALYFLTYASMIGFFAILLGLIFVPAGSWSFALGWVWWASFCGATLAVTAWFLRTDPALIERRVLPSETRPRQIAGQSAAALLFALLIVVPALDHRFGWTEVPLAVSTVSDGLVLGGFLLVFEVFRENTFASRAIETMSRQTVVKTGVYAKVRHPMYSGAALIILATPPALGSWAGLSLSVPLLVVIVLRILDEEALLTHELEGYREYCEETKHRLIPRIW